MTTLKSVAALAASSFLTLLVAGCSQPATEQTAQAPMTLDPDGTIHIHDATVPLSSLLSEGGLEVLKRTQATEGPGAPMPLPSEIEDIVELRRVYNENLKPYVEHMKQVFPVDIEETEIDGISAAIITPKGGVPARNSNRLVLNGPGGGFRTGVRSNGLLISIPMAVNLGVKVISILYRQGPEYRFPAASEDLLKVWNWALKTHKPQNIGMVGCSAGGSLVSQTAAMLIDQGKPTPGALGVYCSGLGAISAGDSAFYGSLTVTNLANGLPTSAAVGGGMSYFDGIDRNQFIVSPTIDPEKLKKYPPTIFFTATRDFAMSGALYSYRQLLKAGVDSQILVYDGLYHGFMTNPDFPESQEAYKLTAAFFDQHLGR